MHDPAARAFYEIEAERENWSVPHLERQIFTRLHLRLLKSRDKAGVMELARKGQVVEHPVDLMKSPIVLDFLGLQGRSVLRESDLETASINELSQFLLELGKGFAFVARQKRITFEDKDFFVDLVFYNTVRANFSGVTSGMSDRSISLSSKRSKCCRSVFERVEEEHCLTNRCLSCRNERQRRSCEDDGAIAVLAEVMAQASTRRKLLWPFALLARRFPVRHTTQGLPVEEPLTGCTSLSEAHAPRPPRSNSLAPPPLKE